MMEFQKLINRALDLQRQYAAKESALYGSPSTAERIAEGFLGDVKNIARIIQAGPPGMPGGQGDERIAALLAHGLWSLIILAQMHSIDVQQTFMETMDRLEAHLLEAD